MQNNTIFAKLIMMINKFLYSNYLFKLYQRLKNTFIKSKTKYTSDIVSQNLWSVEDINENSILLISHELTKTGAPLLLLNIANTLKHKFGKNIILLTLVGGVLQKNFEEFCTVINLHQSSLLEINNKKLVNELFCVLAAKKVSFALGNTVCSAFFVPFLERYQFTYRILVHELPNVIERFGWNKTVLPFLFNMVNGTAVYSSKYVLNAHNSTYSKQPLKLAIISQGMFQNVQNTINTVAKLKLIKKYDLPANVKIIFNGSNDLFRKGADIFYEIAKLVTSKRDDVVFIYLCDKKSLKYKLMFGSESFDSHQIIFDEFSDDYLLYLEGSDVFALTSREDPFPNVLLDSLAHGLPLIAFDNCGGAPDLLREINEVLIAKTLDINDFADKILFLLDNDVVYKNISNRSIQLIRDNYQFDQYVSRLIL